MAKLIGNGLILFLIGKIIIYVTGSVNSNFYIGMIFILILLLAVDYRLVILGVTLIGIIFFNSIISFIVDYWMWLLLLLIIEVILWSYYSTSTKSDNFFEYIIILKKTNGEFGNRAFKEYTKR